MGSICLENEFRDRVEEKLSEENIDYEITEKGNFFQLTVQTADQKKCIELIQVAKNETYELRTKGKDKYKTDKEKQLDEAQRINNQMHLQNQLNALEFNRVTEEIKEKTEEELEAALDKKEKMIPRRNRRMEHGMTR